MKFIRFYKKLTTENTANTFVKSFAVISHADPMFYFVFEVNRRVDT